MSQPKSNDEIIFAIKKAYLNSIDDLDIANCWNNTILPVIKEALAQKDAEVARAIKYIAWCPQCGDALEQQGTDNDYSCFGCGDVHYQLVTHPTKQTEDLPTNQ